MTGKKSQSTDYRSLSVLRKKNGLTGKIETLKPLASNQTVIEISENPLEIKNFRHEENGATSEIQTQEKIQNAETEKETSPETDYSQQQKILKKQKKTEKDWETIKSDRWIEQNGHTLTYIGLYLFSVLVLFRPYELIPALGFLSATAFYFALATLLIYLPTQITTEGTLTFLTTEVKAILALTLAAIITMPISRDFKNSWEVFNDTFIKSVLIFIVMVNVLRTRKRLMGLIWLSISVAVVLSYMAIGMYLRGELKTEGYRVSVEVGGMFGNPNDMAMHLVMMTPLVICLGLASKNVLLRILYFAMAIFFVSANMVTFSRGGFLGLIGAGIVMTWKLGRKNRLKTMLFSAIAGLIVILVAPGNYGLRILSIFIPGLDEAGSSNQRRELLDRSLFVTARNPWGVGIGNFPIMNDYNLQTHNAYTQVSSELGIVGLIFYLIFLVSPFRKLSVIERIKVSKNEKDWFFYMSVGLQASMVAYMISSFFGSVAYNWFAYFIIAYAVAFRRIYRLETGDKDLV